MPGTGVAGFVFVIRSANGSQVDEFGISAAGDEALPCSFRGRDVTYADGLSEIVSAADGHNEGGNLLVSQTSEMAVNGAVSAEDEHGFGLIGGVEFVAGEKIDARQLKGPEVMWLGVRSQQSNGAHRVTFAYGREKNKMCVVARSLP